MRERARTVIVGGGPAAAAVAAALAARGETDALILDARPERPPRDEPLRRFGAVLQSHPASALARLARDSVARLADLAASDPAVWRTTGSVEVATTAERLAVLRDRAGALRADGIGAEVVDPDGAAALVAGLDPRAILGGLHVPTDGVADRAAVGAALARSASAAGVGSVAGVVVTAVRTDRGRIVGVETDGGPIACERLVLASCTDAVRVAALVGVRLPVVEVARPIRASGPVVIPGGAEAFPVVRHPDAGFVLRALDAGFAIASHLDAARIGATAAGLLPGFADVLGAMDADPPRPSDSTGEPTVTATPDGMPIAGPDRAHPGLWFFLGARLAWIPALADLLVEAMLATDAPDPRADPLPGAVDPHRWYPFEVSKAVAAPRAREIVARAHDVAPPTPDELPPRDLRLSPIHRRSADAGAVWTAVAGWEVARHHGDVDAEVRAVRDACGVADRTHLAKFDLDGVGAWAAAARLLGLDPDAPEGSLVVVEAPDALPDAPTLTVARKSADLVRVVAHPRAGQRVLAWLRAAVADDDRLRVTERTGSLFAITVVGPRAADVIAAATTAATTADAAAFPTGTARSVDLGPVVPVWAHRPAADVPTWDLFGQFAMGEAAWDVLLRAGRDIGLTPVGSDALARLGLG